MGLTLVEVDAEVTHDHHMGRAAGPGHPIGLNRADAPHDAANSRLQLLRAERFHHVVVGAKLQTRDPVCHIAEGGQQDDRDLRLGTNALGHGKTVELRHHHVENHDIRF